MVPAGLCGVCDGVVGSAAEGFGVGRIMRRGALTGVLMFMQSVRREWRNRQTRTVQVRVPERAWGFNSPLAHKQQAGQQPRIDR